ncbi:MAG: hypothetical protein VXX85_02820 [Candidatus Margulisiibacteriota bacterium]|nr:hypothetical protein [Candidatus Margulisiibacteriota bacterium]
MRYLIVAYLCLFSILSFSMEDKIINYILNDIHSKNEFKTRLTYFEPNDDPWQILTSLKNTTSFPNIKKYLNIDPVFEFSYFSNHIDSNYSLARLNQAYFDIYNDNMIVSFGDKRLNFQQGQFISDSSFNLINRSFSQLSISNLKKSIQLYYLFSVTNPDSDERHTFSKGSYVFVWNIFNKPKHFDIRTYTYLIQDQANTYFLSPSWYVNSNNSILLNIAYQGTPTVYTNNANTKEAYYYDASYLYQRNFASFKLGTRYFRGSLSGKYQFIAPYSSGHSWDGYLNTYHSNVQNGFTDNFQSIFSVFTFKINKNKTIILSNYLFRSPDLTKDYGYEFNLAISQPIIPDTVFWTYKLGQYMSGYNTDLETNLGMWLDFGIRLDNN